MHAALLVALMAIASAVPALRGWPWLWLAPLSVYGALAATVPALRRTLPPVGLGRVTGRDALLTLALAAVSCAALVAYQALARPDLRGYRSLLPVGTWVGVLLFPPANALFEEVVFRGVLFDTFTARWGRRGALLLTSVLFGIGHLHGYPPGPVGAALAGVYGLCLGGLRVASGGLLLPVLAHIVADATIVALVVR